MKSNKSGDMEAQMASLPFVKFPNGSSIMSRKSREVLRGTKYGEILERVQAEEDAGESFRNALHSIFED
jgi:hypothetical protein